MWTVLGGRGKLPVARWRAADMLEMRPNCECCDRDVAATARDVFVCSFECTFCVRCAQDVLRGVCPNCKGELVRRPAREGAELVKHPASTKRVFKPAGCAAARPARGEP